MTTDNIAKYIMTRTKTHNDNTIICVDNNNKPDDYDKVRQDDYVSIEGFDSFAPGKNLTIVLSHKDGTTDKFEVAHTYNQAQIDWVGAGSALNKIRTELGA